MVWRLRAKKCSPLFRGVQSRRGGGCRMREEDDAIRCFGECSPGVVVAAGHAEKTQLSQTIGAATVARFLTRARQMAAF